MVGLQRNNMEKYILITGSSSGIGRETAIMLSKHSNILLHGRDLRKLKETKALCYSNSKILIWQYDLIDAINIETALRDFIKSNNMLVKSFVHSAGYMKMLPLKMTNLTVFHATMNVNLVTPALISKVLINKNTNESALSSIVFISSNISNFGAKAFSAYGSSKSAIDGLMRCLAIELAPFVRVNSVLPGGVRTEMTEPIFENKDVLERMKNQYPLGLGETLDIANAVNFLISEQARWITGQQITVDGGRTINITG